MINHKILERAHRTIQKCAGGSTVQPVSDKTKQKFAQKNGLVFQNGQFFQADEQGNPLNAVDVTESDLQGFQQAADANKASMLNQVGQSIDTARAALFSGDPNVTNQSAETQMANGAYDMASNVVSTINPLAGTIMKAGGFAADALTAAGIGTDQQTGLDKALDSKFLKLTPVGLINAIGASSTQDFSIDQDTIEKVGGSYGGTVAGLQDASDKAGKKYGLFSSGARKRADRYINEMRRKQNMMANIASETSDQRGLVNAMGDVAAQAYQAQISGGFDARYFRAADGGKMPEEFEPEFIDIGIEKIVPSSFKEGGLFDEIINPTSGQIEKWQPEIVECDKFADGGKVEKQLDAPETEHTAQQNIIPEGALHAHKHHMDNADELTKKGIPVVDEEHQQQAEIERNEIIFTKEVTQKLEELYKVYYSDESSTKDKEQAAIDAGKLLTKEIMLNTDDRTGLIDTLQQGGTVNLTKPDYKEWLTSVNQDYLSKAYDLEKAFEVLPFETLEKWRKETLKDKPSDSDDWHLPSTYQVDESTIMFLKKGKTAKDNPELQGEFNFYTSTPEFSRKWQMQFNDGEGRWYYKKRVKDSSDN